MFRAFDFEGSTWSDALETPVDDFFAGLKTFGDNPLIADESTEFNGPSSGFFIGSDHDDVSGILVDSDRLFGNDYGLIGLRDGNSSADKHAGLEQIILVVKDCSEFD